MAKSWHSGGVNVLYLDGAVKFISDRMDLKVWQASATIAGKD